MYYEEDFVYDDIDCRRHRRHDREKFICRRCGEVGGKRHCGCGSHDWDRDKDCDRDRDRDKDCDRCKGCVCDQLKKLHPGVKVEITTDDLGDLEEFTFSNFDKKTCCAFFADGDDILVVDCRDLKAIKLLAAP